MVTMVTAMHDALGKGSPEEVGAEAVVDQAQHGKDAGLDHRHRVEQSGHRRGRHRGVGQPAVEGETRPP